MSQDITKASLTELGTEEFDPQFPTSDQQMDVLNYGQDVNKARGSLVEQVTVDQEESARIVEQTRKKLKQQKTHAEEKTETLEQEVEDLRSLCMERETQLVQTQTTLNKVVIQLREAQHQQNDTSTDEATTVALKNQLHDMEEASKAAKRQIIKLEKTLMDQAGDVNVSQIHQQELKEKSIELAEQAKLLEAAQHAADTFKTELQEHSQQDDTLTQNLSDAQATIGSLQSDFDKATKAEETLKQELRDVNKQISQLKYSLNEEQQKRTGAEQSLSEALASSQIQETQNKVRKYQERIAALEHTEHASAETILRLQAELKTSNQQVATEHKRLNDLRARAKATLEAGQQKNARIQYLEDQLRANQEIKTHQEDVHLNLYTQINTLEEQLISVLNHNRLLEDELSGNGNIESPEPKVDLDLKIIETNNQLGNLLLKSGAITNEQLQEVLHERKLPGYDRSNRIGQQFVDKGYATEDVVAQAIAHQMKVPFLRIERNTIKYNAIRHVDAQLAKMHSCIPAYVQAGFLMLAMVNPMDLVAIEDIERSSGLTVKVMVATSEDIKEAIKQYYKKSA